jgi:chemotaxis regulatin CheY-phosphate phosphatase CheZ
MFVTEKWVRQHVDERLGYLGKRLAEIEGELGINQKYGYWADAVSEREERLKDRVKILENRVTQLMEHLNLCEKFVPPVEAKMILTPCNKDAK